MEDEFVIKEGWAVKESGQAVLGQTNWRKRWCRLVRNQHGTSWSYYRKMDDIASNQPAGRIELDSTYAARELEEGERKKKPNCFALGPVFDNFARRTYYISCETVDDKLSWMEVLNAATESETETQDKFDKRRISVKKRLNRRSGKKGTDGTKEEVCLDPLQRMEQWTNLCGIIDCGNWKKTDTKNGITISRLSFTHNDKAAVKVEGVIPVHPDIAYDYLRLAMQKGGKLDQPFRGEEVLQKIDESIPHAWIVYNKYSLPLPSASPRDVCLQRMWMPSYLTRNGTSGMVLWSTHHSQIPQVQGFTRVQAGLSGFVLSPITTSGSLVHTKAVLLVQIDVQDSLQTMLEGSYKSGLLKIGLRTAFAHISHLVEQYYDYIQG
ncbi:uncharacterized protein LOC144633972 [Oculina patagonica]